MSNNDRFRNLLTRVFRTRTAAPIRRPARPFGRPIEQLEDRAVPSAYDLAQNGEFENPNVGSGFATPTVPSWSNTADGGTIELWGQGFSGSPTLGTDGPWRPDSTWNSGGPTPA